MRRFLHGCNVVWACLVLCILHPVAVFAEDWEVYVPDDQTAGVSYQAAVQPAAVEAVEDPDPDDEEDDEYDDYWDEIELINDLATGSDWQDAQTTSSNAGRISGTAAGNVVQNDGNGGIMLLSNYSPYDSSISSSVVAYYEDVIPKLGQVHYVLFRSGQYTYRLVYGKDLQYDNGYFSGTAMQYVAYSTRDYTWQQGSEGTFSLSAGDYLVYSDLGDYPMLHSAAVYQWLLILLGAVYLLYVIFRAMFSPRRVSI